MVKDDRYEIAQEHGFSKEFVDWFYDTKKDDCGNVWFISMCAMWEGWKGALEKAIDVLKKG